jgi:enamine deaminase RidA (YjgF/YER057c/UK114 family)
MSQRTLQPIGWPRPRGYANGIAAIGETIFVGGQIGWDAEGEFRTGLVAQIEQALHNIVAVLAEAGAGPEHLVRLTWYLVDIEDYRAQQAEIGAVYRAVFGRNFPAMSVVQVTRLVEPKALVEIEATAMRSLRAHAG